MNSMSSILRTLILAAPVLALCPSYEEFARSPHEPLSAGALRLSFARPEASCRSIVAVEVENTISDIKARLKDPDLARLFENTYPNALDTAMQFTASTVTNPSAQESKSSSADGLNLVPVRYSAQQLRPYRKLMGEDPVIAGLYRGVIRTQAQYLLNKCEQSQTEKAADQFRLLYACKLSTDSFAYFLELSADYLQYSNDPEFFDTIKWLDAVNKLLDSLHAKASTPGCSKAANQGDECVIEDSHQSKLIAFAFRPSNDKTILPFVIPANAYLSAQLTRAADVAAPLMEGKATTARLRILAHEIKRGIESHGIVNHEIFGQVYAYEVDGRGGALFFDDAKIPNLLGLPLTGFVDMQDQTYLNTRRMVLNKTGNKYYYEGRQSSGVGSSTTGPDRPWPSSSLVAIQTSANPEEVSSLLTSVGNATAGLGLLHESVDMNNARDYTRPWFPIANSLFGDTILDILDRFPGLLDSHRRVR